MSDFNNVFDEDKSKAVKEPEVQVEIVPENPPEDTKAKEAAAKEQKEYGERVQKRISDLTKKWKTADELRVERENEIAALRAELTQLKSKPSVGLDVHSKSLESRVAVAKRALAQALSGQDANSVAEAQAELNEAQLELRLAKQQATQPVVETPKPRPTPQVQKQAGPNPKAAEWAFSQPWWGKDSVLTAAAYALDVELQNGGSDPDSDEHYQLIEKRLKKELPNKFKDEIVDDFIEETPRQRRQSPVTGGSRSSERQPEKVRLTEREMAIAKRFNMTPQEYAKQKLAAERAATADTYTVIDSE